LPNDFFLDPTRHSYSRLASTPQGLDSQGISAIDVETHLDNMGLGQEITKATGGRMKLDRSTENLLAFNADGSKSVPDSATGNAQWETSSGDKPWWKVW
jgi:hypothetical protein